ncbi:MAG: DHHW family protein [Lachnospiraceae bacterium]
MKKQSAIYCLFFAALLFMLTGMSLFQKDKAFSGVENRVLQERPKPTKKGVRNGQFAKKYEKYLSDQFPFRQQLVSTAITWERLLGKTEINGVYFGQEDYLLTHYAESDFDKELVSENLRILKKVVRRHTKQLGAEHVRVMMVPSKSYSMADFLPAYAKQYSMEAYHAEWKEEFGGQYVDVSQVLSEGTGLYYKTDHHWTSAGAYEAYAKYCESIGTEAMPGEQYQKEVVTTDFKGTTYAKVPAMGFGDEITLYRYEGDEQITVDKNMGEERWMGLYDPDKLENPSDSMYDVFLGGNAPLLDMRTSIKNGRILFLAKDSFANCMIPFLTQQYERIVVADFRYLSIHMDDLLNSYPVTDVLFLYEDTGFLQEKNIFWLE